MLHDLLASIVRAATTSAILTEMSRRELCQTSRGTVLRLLLLMLVGSCASTLNGLLLDR
jgi:hypothetical protein